MNIKIHKTTTKRLEMTKNRCKMATKRRKVTIKIHKMTAMRYNMTLTGRKTTTKNTKRPPRG